LFFSSFTNKEKKGVGGGCGGSGGGVGGGVFPLESHQLVFISHESIKCLEWDRVAGIL